jgi:hypothetical protein
VLSVAGALEPTAFCRCLWGRVSLKPAPALADKEAVVKKRLCANGTACVAYAALGQPAKLSRSNRAKVCFRCEERRVDARLQGVGRHHRDVDLSPLSAIPFGRPRCCVNYNSHAPCTRPAVSVWLTTYLCEEHEQDARKIAPEEPIIRLTWPPAHDLPGWWFTPEEAAALLGVRSSRVLEWVYAGEIEKVGSPSGRVRICGESLVAFAYARSIGLPHNVWL